MDELRLLFICWSFVFPLSQYTRILCNHVIMGFNINRRNRRRTISGTKILLYLFTKPTRGNAEEVMVPPPPPSPPDLADPTGENSEGNRFLQTLVGCSARTYVSCVSQMKVVDTSGAGLLAA